MSATCDKCGQDAPNRGNGPRDHQDAEECIQDLVRTVAQLQRRVERLEADKEAEDNSAEYRDRIARARRGGL